MTFDSDSFPQEWIAQSFLAETHLVFKDLLWKLEIVTATESISYSGYLSLLLHTKATGRAGNAW